MKLKKFIKLLDPIGDIIIWTDGCGDEPVYEGSILDMPWIYLDYQIGRVEGEDDEEPVYISKRHKNQYGVELPCLVINLIEK